jgi:solute:Na+ symporter, SSS family
MGMSAISLIGTVWCLISPWPVSWWALFWEVFGLGVPLVIAIITTVWLGWGGFSELRIFFAQIRIKKVNHADDGRVINHRNAGE